MRYAMGTMCARCRIRVDQVLDCLGESAIYSPTRAFTLCEQCFLEEEKEIDDAGGNNLPSRIELYLANLRAGPRSFRAAVPPLTERAQL